MRPDEAAALANKAVAPPWDDLRAARVQKKVIAASKQRAGARDTHASSRVRWAATLAAACAVLAAVLFFVLRDGWNPRATEPSAARLELPDGSLITLSPVGSTDAARVVPRLVSAERVEVEQLSGVATYDVAKVPSRTFVVRCDDVVVEVIGTSFRIEKVDRAVRVTVIEGRVRVRRGDRAVELLGGDDITFGPTVANTETPPPSAAPPTPEAPPTPSGSSRVEAPHPSASASAAVVIDAAKLFRNADDARAAGDLSGALKHLWALIAEYPRDARVPLAHFTIGRIELQRGKTEAAASAFERSGAAMNGEGLAEAALARSSLGHGEAARSLAERYLESFPDGPRAAEMKTLVR